MKDRIKNVLSVIKQLPLYEKMLFFIALFSVVGVLTYYICCIPYTGNSETFHPLLLAKEIIHTGQLLPTDWTFRNAIWFFSSHLVFLIPAFFSENTSVCIIVASITILIGGCVTSIYCSRKLSSNNCWLIFIAILWCGMSNGYLRIMFGQYGYLFQITFNFLIYTLVAKSFDNKLKIESWKKIIASSLMIILMGVSGITSFQTFLIPLAGGLILYFGLDHFGSDGLYQTVKDKSLRNMLVGVGVILGASVIGYAIYAGLISNNIVGFFKSSESSVLFVDDVGTNLHKLIMYFVDICGIENQSNMLSFKGVVGVFKIAINILMLIVFPLIQLTKYKNESTGMKLFMLFALVHVAEIMFLSIFCTTLTAERYLYTSILLMYYISAHYIFKYILCSEKKFGVKAFTTVFAMAVFAVPSTYAMLEASGNYENNVKISLEVTDFLQSKGLTYGYGTYWNSDNLTAYSDFKVKVNKVRVNKTVYPHYFMCSSYSYSEKAHQGPTFLLLTGDENETFLSSESYVKFGEPSEVCTIGKYTVYIYDYNISYNNFGGETAGFTGSELENISAVCSENNIDVALGYDSGYITSICRGDTNKLAEIRGDSTVLLVTYESLAEPAKELDVSVGGYSLYACKMSEIEYSPNPNYISDSDFNDGNDLSKWSVGDGEAAVCSDGILTITCIKESNRLFNRTITIGEEQIGKPMTFSLKVNKAIGNLVSRIYGADFNADRYITATITEPGVYAYTFVPTSAEVTIQPIVPSSLGSSAEIDWVKLENGNIFTGYDSTVINIELETDVVNLNLAAGSDFADSSDLEIWDIGSGETVSCEDGALLITCTEERNRLFNQTIQLSEDQIGKPMTLSYEVIDIEGYVYTRVWGYDFSNDRYISEIVTEPGTYFFTFTPTSNEITIQPVLPEKLNNSAAVEWIKLEEGTVATDYIPYVA